MIQKKKKSQHFGNFNFWFEMKNKHLLVLPSFHDNARNKNPLIVYTAEKGDNGAGNLQKWGEGSRKINSI